MWIGICEDDPADGERIAELCARHAREHKYEASIVCFNSNVQLLAHAQVLQASLLLLDIMINGKAAGIEAARKLRQLGYRGAIVLITSSPDFYPEGFEVGALHYLIKPIDYPSFSEAMQRVLQIVHRPESVVTLPVENMPTRIPVHTILFAESEGRHCRLHTYSQALQITLTFKELERHLQGMPFLHCFRNYIINMDAVQRINDDHFLLQSGDRIPISKRNHQHIRERYFSYLFEQGRSV